MFHKYKHLKLIDVHNHDADCYAEKGSMEIWERYHIDKTVLFGAISEPAAMRSDMLSLQAYTKYPDKFYPFFSGFPMYDEKAMEIVAAKLEQGMFGESYERPEPLPRAETTADADELAAYAGTYEAFVPFDITVERGRLFLSIFGFRLELFLSAAGKAGDVFVAGAAYVRIGFKKNADGAVTEAAFRWLGERECIAPKRSQEQRPLAK